MPSPISGSRAPSLAQRAFLKKVKKKMSEKLTEKIINIKDENNNITIEIQIPTGKTTTELNGITKDEFKTIKKDIFYGKHVRINGKITTHMAMWLGHELSHICRSVSLFDPKLNEYILVIEH